MYREVLNFNTALVSVTPTQGSKLAGLTFADSDAQ